MNLKYRYDLYEVVCEVGIWYNNNKVAKGRDKVVRIEKSVFRILYTYLSVF